MAITNMWLVRLGSLLIGYFLGNILNAFLVGHLFGKVDPTKVGSNNPGMANVGAVLGKKAGILVLVGDGLKTFLAIAIAVSLFSQHSQLAVLYAGLGVTLGHDFPFWHHFHGGKGVATTFIFALFYNFKLTIIYLLVVLVILLIMKNLTVPPMIFLALMTGTQVVLGHWEVAIVFGILLILMMWQFRKDLVDLAHGQSKRVDLLKRFK